eukprot:gene6965-biopygen1139
MLELGCLHDAGFASPRPQSRVATHLNLGVGSGSLAAGLDGALRSRNRSVERSPGPDPVSRAISRAGSGRSSHGPAAGRRSAGVHQRRALAQRQRRGGGALHHNRRRPAQLRRGRTVSEKGCG